MIPQGSVARRSAPRKLLRPLAGAPHASVAVRRAYVEVLIRIGYEQTRRAAQGGGDRQRARGDAHSHRTSAPSI